MTYRVFDTSINKLFGAFPTESAAMQQVRALIADDPAFADELVVSYEREDGSFSLPLSGDLLVSRASAILDNIRVDTVESRDVLRSQPSASPTRTLARKASLD